MVSKSGTCSKEDHRDNWHGPVKGGGGGEERRSSSSAHSIGWKMVFSSGYRIKFKCAFN